MTRALSFAQALLALLFWVIVPGTASGASTVALVLSEQGGSYAEFVSSFQRDLTQAIPGVSVQFVKASDLTGAMAPDVNLVVAVGTAAQIAVAGSAVGSPVLAVLSPRQTFERIFSRSERVTALYLDQTEARQLALISALPSQPQSVGLVFASLAGVPLARYRAAAKGRRLRLVEMQVGTERSVAAAVQEALTQSEVLLAHPDPGVFNSTTIQSILLTTYRAKVPVIGFSQAYTRAGALASLHSSAAQLSGQAVAMARQLLAGQLPAAQYPRQFEISTNRQVARSLGIDLPDDEVLVERLQMLERTP